MTDYPVLDVEALTASRFAPFGDVLEATGEPTLWINRGNCARYTDLATIDVDAPGRTGISLFHARPYPLPITIDLLERHPLGSQAFLPFEAEPFLVVVAPDENGAPGTPLAFLTSGRQGVNYHRNTWHAVLTPLAGEGLFAVVDRIGDGDNLQEHHLETPWLVKRLHRNTLSDPED